MRNLRFFLAAVLTSAALGLQAQMLRPSDAEIATLPAWAKAMYAPAPNVWEVDRLYRAYYRGHAFEKNYHTQYYKRWRRAAAPYVADDGSIRRPDAAAMAAMRAQYAAKVLAHPAAKVAGGGWQVAGPQQVRNNSGSAEADHTNVYSLAQSASNPQIMFCGTEPGEIYKSTDAGANWAPVSEQTLLDGGVTAVEVDPTNPNRVFAGSGNYLLRSTNGGNTWATILNVSGLQVNEMKVNPANPDIVFACTERGLYRSTDGGATFTQQFTERSYDLKWHATDPGRAFLVKNNPSLVQCEFFTTADTGATWQLQSSGWYSSSDPGRTDQGARLAVTPADPDRVYAYLIGEAKTGDVGFIGVYKSTDAGVTWTLPNGPAGGPYSATHPNLARGTDTWQYHQGFYNCAIMCSATDPDSILIGGLNLWRSNDGAATFSSVSGYIGGPLGMHVDNQDFRAFGDDYWITTDGGIYHAGSDFFTVQPTVQMRGVHGADYWGFGQGWNEDVLTGGMYHNGNNAYHENYPAQEFLSLGGGEAATGYVNPGQNRRTYYSDIGGRILPLTITGTVNGAAFGLAPNETYFSAESSELEFHPNCYSIAWLGRDNELWRSDDAGGAFTMVHAFGSDPDAQVKYIEVSRSNPQVMYLSQQPSSGSNGQVWKTTDGGTTWATIPLPGSGNKRKILLALDPEDENTLFVALPQAGSGSKVWKTTDSGQSWTNLTTSMLDGEAIHSIVLVGGTANGLYLCTANTVYYRDDNLADWELFNLGLPLQFYTNIGRAFYRDGKIRVASYGKGIWESELHTPQSRPICTPMVNDLTGVCSADTFWFEDHSMLNHANASWLWTFQGGNPATSTLRNPAVTFGSNGQHLVTLTVTDGNGQSDTDSLVVTLTGVTATAIATDFEANFPPTGYTTFATANLSWAQASGVGGYGASSTSTKCDNYNIDGQGSYTDLRAYVNLSLVANGWVTFDVAYAEYGGQYTDTLEVLVSSDCGLTFSRLYRKGGQGLATSPNVTANEFVPTASQWRTDSVDIGAFQGFGEVVVAFRSIGHWGQTMYLDNINIGGTQVVGLENGPQPAYATLSPNPVLQDGSVVLRSNRDEDFECRLYDAQGKCMATRFLHTGQSLRLAELGLATGHYYYLLDGASVLQRGKLVVIGGR